MLQRTYCFAFIAISALLFSLSKERFWAVVFLILTFVPILFSEKNKWKLLTKSFLLFIVFFSFYYYGKWNDVSTETSLSGDESFFAGQVVSEASLTSFGHTSFILQLENGERLQAFSQLEQGRIVYGDYCAFEGTLSEPNSAANPYSFDYKKYLRQQGIHWVVTLNDSSLRCEVKNRNFVNIFLSYRKKIIRRLVEMGDDENNETSPFISALVFGERSDISEERMSTYRQLGIIHLLAVSGLHVGMLTFSIFYLLCLLGFTREKAGIFIIIFLPIYIIIAGGAPSVIRASLMSILFIATSFKRFSIRGINIISIVCLLLLIYNPYYLFHLGFQLSFLTSFALILSQRLFQQYSHFPLTFIVTFVAQQISIPLVLHHFFEVSLLSIPINLLFIPFISMWILPLAYITVFFLTIYPPIAIIPYKLISLSLKIAHMFLDKLASFHWDLLIFGRPSYWMMLALFIASIFLFIALEEGIRKKIVFRAVILFILFVVQFITPYFRDGATVTFLDVGQGDAAVIELPKNKGVYVIDTGGVLHFGDDEEIPINGPGKRVIEPYLKGRGIKKIDHLILTHGHLDHIGEACYIISTFRVENVFYPKSSPIADEARNVFRCIKERHVPFQLAEEGMRWKVDNNLFFVVHPTGKEIQENDRSIVLIAMLEGVTFLFTGDIEEGSERRIIQTYPKLQTDVLKVAHHGSNTSTTNSFLEVMKPKMAVISAGRNNLYGHPHDDVVERLLHHGVIVKMTSKSGAIIFKVNDGNVTVDEMLPPKME